MKYLINIALVLIPLTALAQKEEAVEKLDSLLNRKLRYIPTAVRVGADVIAPIRSFTDSKFGGYELNADVDFYRYYLTVEAGRWERNLETEMEKYSNAGNYFRIGVDVNFLTKDPEKNMFFIGARYGHGKFWEQMSITFEDPIWGTQTDTYANKDVKANWTELTTGLKVKMLGIFWLGCTARYKLWLNHNAPKGFIPHDVPGYGKTYKENTWGFSYYVMFKIPVRKENQVARLVNQAR